MLAFMYQKVDSCAHIATATLPLFDASQARLLRWLTVKLKRSRFTHPGGSHCCGVKPVRPTFPSLATSRRLPHQPGTP
jgi:hypothetical protein